MINARLRKVTRHSAFIPWCLILVFTAIYFASTVGVMNSSDGPDYALTQALVEEHTSQLDHFSQWISPDYITVNKHDYAKRSPGLSLLGTPSYVVARVFQSRAREPYNGDHAGVNAASRIEALTMMFPALCGGITVMLIYLIAMRVTEDKYASLLAASLAGLGSLLWKYDHSYQRMPLYVLLLTLAFYLFMAFDPSRGTWRSTAIMGAVVGYAIVTESTAVFVLPLFLIWITYLILRSDRPPLDRRSLFLGFAGGIGLSLSILAIYDLLSYHELVGNLYQRVPKNSWMTYPALFSTPLFPSVFVNLFNHGTVPVDSFSPVLRDHPLYYAQEGAFWAARTQYKGLFVQSPYLILALPGLVVFARKFKIWALFALAISLVILVTMAKFVDFFSPNTFDTRLFLPMVPFLSIGFAFWWRMLVALPRRFLKFVLGAATGYLGALSIYNGWYSEITDYGPHVTGNTRFDLSQLQYPVLSGAHFFNNLGVLFVNTFPNIYNIWMLAVYADIVLLAYFGYLEARSRMRRRRVVSPPYVTGGAGEGANPK